MFYARLVAGAILAVGVALSAAHPALAQNRNPQVAALSNVTGTVGQQLAGKTCVGIWEVDNKVAGSAMDFAAFRVKFAQVDGALSGTWEVSYGKKAHDAPHATLFTSQGNLMDVLVSGDQLSFKSPRGVPWVATIQGLDLVNVRFDPRTVRSDWSPGAGKNVRCR